jgi:hypothetical protein
MPDKKKVKRPDTPLAATPPVDSYKGLKDAWGNPVGGEGTNAPFKLKSKKK